MRLKNQFLWRIDQMDKPDNEKRLLLAAAAAAVMACLDTKNLSPENPVAKPAIPSWKRAGLEQLLNSREYYRDFL